MVWNNMDALKTVRLWLSSVILGTPYSIFQRKGRKTWIFIRRQKEKKLCTNFSSSYYHYCSVVHYIGFFCFVLLLLRQSIRSDRISSLQIGRSIAWAQFPLDVAGLAKQIGIRPRPNRNRKCWWCNRTNKMHACRVCNIICVVSMNQPTNNQS